MQFGCMFASSFEAVRQAQVAESLGYDYIGFFDTPALEPDVWITIANAVQQTERIRVGPQVLIPHLRHPLTQAAAIATIEQLAPGRLQVALGTGFTGRMAMGQRPHTWAQMSRYVRELRALLAGEEVEHDGGVMQMIHPPGYAPARPIEVPLLIAANGPKGVGVAREVADGLVYGGARNAIPADFDPLLVSIRTIVLDEDETPSSPAVLEQAMHSFTLMYHLAYDHFLYPPVDVDALPHGDDWLRTIEAFPERTRHLKVHDLHTVGVSDHDRAFVERHPEALEAYAGDLAQTPPEVRAQVDEIEAAGVTMVLGGAARPDWERGLRLFAAAVGM